MSKTKPKREFNADARTGDRESEPVTIDSVKYFPTRKTTKIVAEFRTLGRRQKRCGVLIEKLEKEIEELENDGKYDEADTKTAELNKLSTEAEGITFDILALLLLNEDKKSHPDPSVFAENMDIMDAGALGGWLWGVDDEDESDPSQPAATATTSS